MDEELDEADGDLSGRIVDRSAELRDQAGRRRDLAALTRDGAARLRDLEAQRRDLRADEDDAQPGTSIAFGDGDSATVDSGADQAGSLAAINRRFSRADRAAAEVDRRAAAGDRAEALGDRAGSAEDRYEASRDGLTGLYNRESGLAELEREVGRTQRTGHLLVVAFVDVDHLKVVNDTHGHAAGDQLLQVVAHTLSAALRPYDIIMRWGGDEFLCVVEGIGQDAAAPRFARVNTMLARTPGGGSISIGLAQLQPDESSASLIARADADLYRQRR